MDANQVLKRRNLRGLVKCKACNYYNGIRATACKNKKCVLSKVESKPKIKPKINAIQLVCVGESKLFSVQVRDRDIDNRNFVSITDKIISSDASASIISRNAICYVDTCKYDSNDVNISCKHVKSSLESCSSTAKVQKIDEDILMRFQMNEDKRNKLLNMHKLSQTSTPLVQRINQRVFVVRCDVSLSSPIGLLHVMYIVEPNEIRFCCACKKVKHLISISHRSLLGKDVCEHVLLILMAILSDINMEKEFEDLTNVLKPLLTNTNNDCEWISDEIISVPIATPYNDLSSTTMAATLVENFDNIELIQIPNVLTANDTLNSTLFSLDRCDGEPLDMESLPIAVESIPSNEQLNCEQYSEGLELVNYKVELDPSAFEFHSTDTTTNVTSNPNTLNIDGIYGVDDQSKTTDVVLSYLYPEDLSIDDLPMELMETFHKPTLNTECQTQSDDDGYNEYEKMCRSLDDSQLNLYMNWLNSVIETTNLILDFNNDGYPEPLVFSVPHQYFDIFRAKFSAGSKKKRLPNHTSVITDGKYKNLTIFTWIFANIKLIKYILSTETIKLEVVRSFRKTSQNTFEYISLCDINKFNESIAITGNNRKIRPTIYKTFLKVKSLDSATKFQNKINKHGLFVIEWIPNTLPVSKYGEMRIKLQFGHMKNDKIC